MENSCMESDEVMVELAGESNETEDPLAKENTIDTTALANISMGTPLVRQIFPWISDGTAGNMSVEEIEIEEIKIESTDNSDPSWHATCEQKSQLVTEKMHESGQTESSPGTASHNDRQYRRIRCNFCSLLFFSEKTVANHQKKCQLVSEIINAPKAVPVRDTKDILEDLQKRLPQFTVAVTGNEAVGTNSRADDGTPVPQTHHRKSAFSVPIDVTVSIVPKLEAPTSHISFLNNDPLKLESSLVQDSSNSIPPASIPPSTSTTIPCSSSSVFITSRVECEDQESSTAVPRYTAPIDIAVQLKRIENKLALLSKENCLLRESLAMSNLAMVQEQSDSDVFDFEKLTTKNQLEEFEKMLGEDTNYADAMVSLLKKQTGNSNPSNRIVLSLDLLFSRQLFASCTWTGGSQRGSKLPFNKYANIRTLLWRVSGSSDVFVENILKSRLRNAAKRLRYNPGRKPFVKKR
ncbi:AGAP012450-PA-like protein [Anopheles sinensis]|uniref:AGAP012450-PA-like protein n=1 Tax=Anopheles sinensis TaxID=74873 RepID=A0A084WCD0_ANOSI|nr:AGAP012450-PA-like protein [Anopheles sinensis]